MGGHLEVRRALEVGACELVVGCIDGEVDHLALLFLVIPDRHSTPVEAAQRPRAQGLAQVLCVVVLRWAHGQIFHTAGTRAGRVPGKCAQAD